LRRLPEFVERRRELVRLYQELLAPLADHLTLLAEVPGRRSAYHLLVAQLRGGAARRRELFEQLLDAGIRPQVHYIPVHLQPWYRARMGCAPGDCPRAESYYQGCISLPLFPKMADADVERVAAAVRRILSC